MTGTPFTRTLTGAPPELKAPAGTCDTHMHFYSRAYPALPGTLSSRAASRPRPQRAARAITGTSPA